MEVLVGCFIAVVIFVPLSQLLLTGATTAQYSEDYLRALTIAKGQIELFKHAAKINKYAVDKLITAHAAQGGFKDFEVDGIYKVSTEVDPQFHLSELDGLQCGSSPLSLDASLVHVKVRVDWKISGEDRDLLVEAFIDRAYQ